LPSGDLTSWKGNSGWPSRPSLGIATNTTGGNRLFQLNLDEALGKDAAYTAKPSLPGLLTATQVVMNTWEKEYFKQLQRAGCHEAQVNCPNKNPRSANPHPSKKSMVVAALTTGVTSAAIGMNRVGMQRAARLTPRPTRPWVYTPCATTRNQRCSVQARRLLQGRIEVRSGRQVRQVQDRPLLRQGQQALS
jgi:hypothetical protein